MRISTLLSIAIAAAALIGCQGASTSAEAKKTSLVGKWKGEIKMPEASKDDPAAQMGKAMAEMLTSSLALEFPDENHFTMTMIGMPIEGSVVRKGDELTLTPTKIMGMTPEEAKKMNSQATNEDFGKPIKGSISADGETVTLYGDKPGQGEMVFVRDIETNGEAPKKEGPATVSGSKSGVVGKYVADMSTLDESKLTEKQKQELPMIKSIMKTATIELRADKTFTMNMLLEMEGNWSVDGSKVKLIPTKAMGIESTGDTKQEPLYFDFKGGKLWNQPKSDSDPTFAFSKQ